MKFIILLTAAILFIACQPTSKKSGINMEQLATTICDCAQPIVAYNDELKSLAAAGDMGTLTQKMTQGDQIMETAISCIIDQLKEDPIPLLNEELSLLVNEKCNLDQRMAKDLKQKLADFEIPTY